MGAQPWPVGVKILRECPETVTLHMTLPWGVADLLATALELAARLTGSDKLGAQMAAICMECVGTWVPAHDDYIRSLKAKAGVEGLDDPR